MKQFIYYFLAVYLLNNVGLSAQEKQFTKDIKQTQDEYIVGGVETNIAVLPWQVAIIEKNISNNFEGQFCSGAIIGSKWILTAAHCMDDITASDLKVVAGVTSLLNETGQEFDIALITVHPDYFHDGFAAHNDIALIKLRKSINFSSNKTSMIPFATKVDSVNGLTDPGILSTISGWGDTSNNLNQEYSEVLRIAQVPIVSKEIANRPIAYNGKIKDYMLSAGYAEGGIDACFADSGGPLIVPNQNNTRWLVAGIVSSGLGCAQPNNYGIYTRVSYFEDWINEQMLISDIDNTIKRSDVKIFPNPAQEKVNIVLEGINKNSIFDIQVYNILGLTVISNITFNSQDKENMSIDTSLLKKGIYFLKMRFDGESIVKKIMIE